MTSPNRRLSYSNNQLNELLRGKSQFQTFGNHGFRKPETVLYPVNSFLTGYYSSLAFGLVTSFFEIKVCVF